MTMTMPVTERRGGRFSSIGGALLVATPAAVSVVNITLGSYVLAVLIVVMGAYRLRTRTMIASIEWLILLGVAVILVSPYWGLAAVGHGVDVVSPTLGAALSVAYVLPVRWFIGASRRRFITYVLVLLAVGVALAAFVYFNGVETQVADLTTRRFVEFANANFIAAVLATCASFALFLAFWLEISLGFRVGFFLLALAVSFVVYQTGSRASLFGVVAAALGMIFLRWASRFYRGLVLFIMVVSLIIGLFPELFTRLLGIGAGALSTSSTLSRSNANLLDASGRLELWRGAIEAFEQSPIFGWGPGVYGTLFEPEGLPSHSWTPEILASVGILGIAIFMPIIFKSYTAEAPIFRKPRNKQFAKQSMLWNATTAIAVLPSLVLSTHQWNMWAWCVIALWTCSPLLDSPHEFVEKNPRGDAC